jgi:hypothetical protein
MGGRKQPPFWQASNTLVVRWTWDTSMAPKCYQLVFCAYFKLITIRGHYWLIPATSDNYRWPGGPNLPRHSS